MTIHGHHLCIMYIYIYASVCHPRRCLDLGLIADQVVFLERTGNVLVVHSP